MHLGDHVERQEGDWDNDEGEKTEKPSPRRQLAISSDELDDTSDKGASDVCNCSAGSEKSERQTAFGFVVVENIGNETIRGRDESRSGNSSQGPEDEEGKLFRQEGGDETENSQCQEAPGEDRLGAVEVGNTAPQEKEAGEGHSIGGDNPGLLREGDLELFSDGSCEDEECTVTPDCSS